MKEWVSGTEKYSFCLFCEKKIHYELTLSFDSGSLEM